MSRVHDATRTGVAARRPDDRTLDEVWAGLRDALEDTAATAVTVRLRVRAERVVEVVRVADPQLAGPPVDRGPDGSRVLVDAPFRAVGAVRALLGFGDDVEVLAPPDARAAMADAARRAAALYG